MEQKLTFLPQIPQLGIWLKILSQKSCVAPVQNIMVYFPDLLYVLKNTKMPAVLVELGYITNYEDNQRMINEPYQFAYGIYVGLLNYLGLKQ